MDFLPTFDAEDSFTCPRKTDKLHLKCEQRINILSDIDSLAQELTDLRSQLFG